MNLPFIPGPDTIPVNWWWFQILLIFTFLLHIILMNFILGGSLLTLWNTFRGKEVTGEVKSIPTLIALTINFGVPPLLFIQVLYGHLFYTSSILIGVAWLLIVPLLILAYYGAYIFVLRYARQKVFSKISFTIASVFLLLVAFVFVNNNTLMLQPEAWEVYFTNSKGTFLNLSDITVYPRYLHFVIGAVAIAGLGKATFYHFKKNIDGELRIKERLNGIKIFSIATMIQVIIGFWFLVSLPRDIMMLFMGDNLYYTILLALGIVLGITAIIISTKGLFWPSIINALAVLIVMIVLRDLVRHAYLGDVFSPADLVVDPQASPLIVFLLVFVVGIASIYYMIRLMLKPKTN